ncbi:hypothetical protein V2J09_005032 [Rumex salicifolius]
MYSWLRRNLSSKAKTQNPKSTSSEEEEEQFHGITSQLVEFLQSFTADTFKNFSLPEDNQNGEATRTLGGAQVDLSEWQQKHATLVLSKVKELSHLRYLLCPRHFKDRQFWRIYFALVKSHILEYELQAIRLEKLRKMASEDEKSSHSNGVEVEMSDTKQSNNLLNEDERYLGGKYLIRFSTSQFVNFAHKKIRGKYLIGIPQNTTGFDSGGRRISEFYRHQSLKTGELNSDFLLTGENYRRMACEFDTQIYSEGSDQLDDGGFMEFDSDNYGCMHYKRRCKIRSPCCDEIFDCRHCHNEAKSTMDVDPLDRHDIPRHEIKKVICTLCDTEQDVQQYCINCGVCMGRYFCGKCNFFDDDVTKQQYHCDDCGICRTGGKENFFHCKSCGCCYSKLMEGAHNCVEKAMHHNCPVCFEYLFDSMREITALHCGHTIHLECAKEMERHLRYTCPVCSKSICDMSNVWKKLDEEVASTVWILCNDCSVNSEVDYHIVAHKCPSCMSYNTRQTQGAPTSCFSVIR